MLAEGRQRDRDGRGAGHGRRDPARSARPRRGASGRRRRRRLVSQAGPGRVGGDLDEPRPAGRGARRQAAIDVADQLDDGRRADSIADGLGAEATRSRLVAALVRAESARRGDRRSRSPPTPAGESATDRRRTASSSPMSTPSPRTGAAIVRRHGGRSAVGSTRRCRAKPPSARSRHGPTRRSTATRSTEIGARIAVSDGRPRELLARIEATRVMAARTPYVASAGGSRARPAARRAA